MMREGLRALRRQAGPLIPTASGNAFDTSMAVRSPSPQGTRGVQNSCFAAKEQRIAEFAVSERSGVRNDHRPTNPQHRRAVEIDPYNCATRFTRRVQRDRFGWWNARHLQLTLNRQICTAK